MPDAMIKRNYSQFSTPGLRGLCIASVNNMAYWHGVLAVGCRARDAYEMIGFNAANLACMRRELRKRRVAK